MSCVMVSSISVEKKLFEKEAKGMQNAPSENLNSHCFLKEAVIHS